MRKVVLVSLILLALALSVPSMALGHSAPTPAVLNAAAAAPASHAANEGSSTPWLGTTLVQLNPRLAQRLGQEQETGTLVLYVIAESPAHAAGLQSGDIILAVDGTTVKKPQDVAKAVRGSNSGETLTLSIQRAGEEQGIDVVMEENPVQRLLKPQKPPFLRIVAALAPHLQQAEISIQDQDESPVALTLIAGTISAPVKENTLTVTPKDGGADFSLTLSEEVHFFGKGHTLVAADLAEGDEVIILMKDGALEAVLVVPVLPPPGGRQRHGGLSSTTSAPGTGLAPSIGPTQGEPGLRGALRGQFNGRSKEHNQRFRELQQRLRDQLSTLRGSLQHQPQRRLPLSDDAPVTAPTTPQGITSRDGQLVI